MCENATDLYRTFLTRILGRGAVSLLSVLFVNDALTTPVTTHCDQGCLMPTPSSNLWLARNRWFKHGYVALGHIAIYMVCVPQDHCFSPLSFSLERDATHHQSTDINGVKSSKS